MTAPKVISISHAIDPDGIGSQAILFRYFRELNIEPIGYLVDYYNFTEYVLKAINEKPNILIVSDIGLNTSYLDQIISPLRRLEARKIWIDHHRITDEHKQLLESILDEFIHDTTVCAAELVQERFRPEDDVAKKIARIAHNGDFDVEDKLADIYYTIIDYYRSDMDKLISIREKFASGNFEQKYVMDEYLEAYKVFEAEKDRIRKSYKIIRLGNISIAVAESAILPRGKVAKFLDEICVEDIYLSIDTTNFRIGLRSNTYDVGLIAAKLGGGGHTHRSGFTYKNALNYKKQLTSSFKNDLTAAIRSVVAKSKPAPQSKKE
ncbi:MAG: DHH family phosphoesterase [Asgard group archaeon]|nr:DHH family phosphoesterase [Asgard group archaeon]